MSDAVVFAFCDIDCYIKFKSLKLFFLRELSNHILILVSKNDFGMTIGSQTVESSVTRESKLLTKFKSKEINMYSKLCAKYMKIVTQCIKNVSYLSFADIS